MPSILFKIKRRLVSAWLQVGSFNFWQKYGYHVMRVHYYSAIPDTSKLGDKEYNRVSELVGLRLRKDEQLELLKKFIDKYRKEYDLFPDQPAKDAWIFHTNQTTFRYVDAQALYCFVREFAPKKMIEIGSGYSTMISAQAIRQNKLDNPSYDCDFRAIEPYPNPIIKAGFPGLNGLIDQPVQDVPLETFTSLGENDILFIDSTHTVKLAGDVNYEFLEILPRLKKGVIVHVHDIFLPYEYPRNWAEDAHLFWAEQYLVHAFLLHNDSFEILWMSHYLHRTHSGLLKDSMKYYDPNSPFVGSLWMRKIK
jgi:predicted O-methyltransferase YrrM